MSQIPPHFWLELLPAGVQARESRSLRMEDRELIAAIGSSPTRVLDVFRRLRWTDSQAFQDSLSHMIMRQWVVAREQRQDPSPPEAEGDQEKDHSDPLMALLARHAEQAPDFLMPAVFNPEDTDIAASGESQEPGPALKELEKWPAPQEPEDSDIKEDEERHVTEVVDTDRSDEEQDSPIEFSEEDTAALLSAMGLQAVPPLSHPPTPSDSPSSSAVPTSVPPSPAHDALLKVLLRGEPVPKIDPVIEVPAYEIPPADSPESSESDDFVRLRDMQATKPTPSPSAPAPPPARPMTEAERRRQEARQQMLESARREQAQREALKERTMAMEAKKQAAQEKREETLKHQRAMEASQRTSTFLGRAERARRIRDGLPLDSDKDR